MTKADLANMVYEKIHYSKKDSNQLVELTLELIKETLERNEKAKISGFGNFEVRQKRSRTGRNPQTGEEIAISARKVLIFRPSQVLKKKMNADR